MTVLRSTITGNTASQGGGGIYVGTYGYNGKPIESPSPSLTLTNSTISGNSVSGRCGGGFYIRYGYANVSDSTITNNYASGGGAGVANWDGTIVITRSTVSGNTASNGGGLYSYDGVNVVLDSTISENSSYIYGGGVYANSSSSTTIDGTIIANNGGGDLFGTYTGSNNLVDDSTYSQLSGDSNLNEPAMLAPLGYYGGPTETMPLLADSPALHHGADIDGTSTDQRGFGDDSPPDIGAFQTQPLANPQSNVLVVNTAVDAAAVGVGQFSLLDAVNLVDALGEDQTIAFSWIPRAPSAPGL